MTSKYSCFLSLFLAFALAGCDSPNATQLTSGDPPVSQDGGAVARLQFKLGPVGVVAGRSMAESPMCILIRFYEIPSEDGALGRWRYDTLRYWGAWRGASLSKTYRFEPGTRWRVEAKIEESYQELYYGEAEFAVVPNRTVDVSLDMDAMYSVGKIRVPIVDSMTRFVMKVAGSVKVDYQVEKQSQVGQILEFNIDRIPASAKGEINLFEIFVVGEMWGQPFTLYRMQDSIRIVSGESPLLQLGLTWVGPTAPPPAGANLVMRLGAPSSMEAEVFYRDTAGTRDGVGEFADPRSGYVYPYKRIGTQTWMLRNIGAECFDTSADVGALVGRCQYGTLFTDTAISSVANDRMEPQVPAMDFRGACPAGWHIPDTTEWRELVRFAARGETDSAGAYRLRSRFGWFGDHPISGGWEYVRVAYNGNDELGFGLFPTLYITPDYLAKHFNEAEMFSSTPGCRLVRFDEGGFKSCSDFKYWPMSSSSHKAAAVRCIKDVD